MDHSRRHDERVAAKFNLLYRPPLSVRPDLIGLITCSLRNEVLTLNESRRAMTSQDKELESSQEKTSTVVDHTSESTEYTRVANDETTLPEGGLRAWSVVAGVFLSQFCSFGYTNAYGVYNDFYVRRYLVETSTSSQISWIGSVQLWLCLSVGLFTGRAFDAGYFYHLMIGGSILFVFSLFMVSITQPEHYYQLFLSQGIGLGLAIGILYVPGLGILSHYFKRRRALAIGIATCGSAVGGALHPIMLNKWFQGSLGFHSGVKASAGLNAGLLIISLLLMKPKYPPNRKKANSTFRSMRLFLRDPPYVIMIFGTVITLSGLYYPIFFVQLNAIKNGISPNLAFYTIAILNAASVMGRISTNALVYRLGAFNVVVFCIFIASVLVFCTLAIKTAAGTITFAILYGFFSGAYVSLLAPMIGTTADNDSEIGARLGICFTFTGFGGLVGTPIAGALLSTSFIWWRPTIYSGVAVLSGSICFFTSRWLLARRRHTQWI
ncbi:MFS transporter asaE [Psilocybe cubensis]|uniref:MFS general substrate transporter n=2 Tax=Psilocybe cubensis TaxID=181762 RepID=A0A8H8CHD1_PSICU|nr:MFS transporter asaE [Psilocybe cubensis]KAH9474434.1 MFS transporter asaE [Psilocybe cubensis]